MKITIQRSTLLERLSQVAKAVAAKSAMPILEGVLIESKGKLTLTGSDTVFTAMTTLSDYEEHEPGSVVIPAKKFAEIIDKLPDKPVTVETDSTSAKIICGSKKITLPITDAEEYPRKDFPEGETIKLDIAEFLRMVEGTRFAVSTNEQMPVLMGLNIKRQSERIMITATDRHRLAKQLIELDADPEENGNYEYVVPAKVLGEIAKIIRNKVSEIEISFSDSHCFIRAGAFDFIVALQDGTYPDTSKIIPTVFKTTVSVETAGLLQTLELAASIANRTTNIVTFNIFVGELQIKARDEGSDMEESLQAEVDGDPMRLSANAKYLIDALKCITTKRVDLKLTSPMSPVIICGEDDDSGLHLVLPYRTNG